MARYLIHPDTASSYGATDPRPLLSVVDCDPSQITYNTPAGYLATATSSTVQDLSPELYYVTWNGSAFVETVKEPLYDFVNGWWNINFILWDDRNNRIMDDKAPPAMVSNATSDTFGPAPGNEVEWQFPADGSTTFGPRVRFGASLSSLPVGSELRVEVQGEAYVDDADQLQFIAPGETHFDLVSSFGNTSSGSTILGAEFSDGLHRCTLKVFPYRTAVLNIYGLS